VTYLKVMGRSVKHITVKRHPVGNEGEGPNDKVAKATLVVIKIRSYIAKPLAVAGQAEERYVQRG
jgi:hypothetical protein